MGSQVAWRGQWCISLGKMWRFNLVLSHANWVKMKGGNFIKRHESLKKVKKKKKKVSGAS